MAPTKRNRTPTRITSNKRPRYTQPDTDSASTTSAPSSSSSSNSSSSGSDSDSDSDKDEASNNSEKEWEATRILVQRGQGFGLEYLIEWNGIDPSTGKRWEPSWEKAKYASETLRKSWEKEKARLAQGREETTFATNLGPRPRGRPRKEKARLFRESEETTATTEGPRPRGRPRKEKARLTHDREDTTSTPKEYRPRGRPRKAETTAAAKVPRKRGRPRKAEPAPVAQNRGAKRRRIVESSESSSESELELSTETASSAAPTPVSVTVDLDASWSSPQVNIDARSDYSSHSEVPESAGESPTEATELHSSELFVSQPAFRASGFVLNTQSSAGDVSYIPVTQEELESSLQSYTDHGSEDHVTSDLVSVRCLVMPRSPQLIL